MDQTVFVAGGHGVGELPQLDGESVQILMEQPEIRKRALDMIDTYLQG